MQAANNCRYIDMSLPADRDMMLLVRLATSGALARTGVTIDMLDDFKTAIEEACSCLISQIASPGRIALRFDIGDKLATFTCSCADGCPTGRAIDPSELEVASCILDSLVDKSEIEICDGVIIAIRLFVELPGRGD